MKRRSLVQLLGGMALPGTSAFAQSGSGKPLRLVLPLSTGTLTDTVCRMIAPKLSAILNQPVVVDNKPGGNGLIGVQEVLRAAPDGNTLLAASVSSLAINMALLKNPPYDSRRDFTPIAGAYVANHVWMVKPSFPARTFPEFIAYAKKNPGKISAGHFSTLVKIQYAAIEKMAGIELLQVPYKAIGPALTDLMGGTLDLCLTDTSGAVPYAKAGTLRILGISAPTRNPLVPDWPCVAEFVPGFDFTSWTAMVGPLGMQRDVVNRLNAAITQALKQPDISEKLIQAGTTPMIYSPEELKSFIDTEVTKWTRVVREAKLEQE